MNYEIWSAKSKNLIETFESRDLALAEVRAIAQRQGAAYAERLVLVGEDEQGESVRIAAGAALVQLALEDAGSSAPVAGVPVEIA